jgi:hypothetical protein
MSGKGERPTSGVRQIVVVHRNSGSLDREAYAIKFEGPSLTDEGLERLGKVIAAALRREGCKVLGLGYTSAIRGVGWGLRRSDLT